MQAIALTLRPLALGLFCFIAGDMAGGSYPWAAHMPYAAVAVGAIVWWLLGRAAALLAR